jgi:hypothetical protein
LNLNKHSKSEGNKDTHGVDVQHWAANVASYGSLFYRIEGKAGQLLDYA